MMQRRPHGLIDRVRRALCFYLGIHTWVEECVSHGLIVPVCHWCGRRGF